MPSNDLSNQKIKDTYGRVVQYVSGSFYDLLGNLIPSNSGSVVSSSYAATASYVPLIAGPNIVINYKPGNIEISSSATINANLDGGSANASYLPSQIIDGGNS